MKNRFIAVDIGNTSAFFAAYNGNKIVKTLRLGTVFSSSPKALPVLAKWGKGYPVAVIASVVPAASLFLRKKLPRIGIRALVIGRDLQAPVKNRYKNPKQVGADRLVNAVAAHELYRKDAIVIDFGTAITFDVVSKKGEYLGGVIAPGIEISLDALFQKTALLPKIRLSHPRGVVGRDTIESIRSGCSFGIGGLCDRVVEEIRRQHRLDPIVIATGGYAKFMAKYCHSIDKIDPHLTLTGIRLTYENLTQ
jgi:type III pantothenate kinase